MPTKTISNLSLYGKIENLTNLIKETLTLEEIQIRDIYQKLYHVEPQGVTLEIHYLPTGSRICLYGSSEKISQIEPILQSALEKIAQNP